MLIKLYLKQRTKSKKFQPKILTQWKTILLHFLKCCAVILACERHYSSQKLSFITIPLSNQAVPVQEIQRGKSESYD